jgi:toxin YhaV
LFSAQIEKLKARVEKLASTDPEGYTGHPATKLLATIRRYVKDVIPRDPSAAEFRQGNTPGPENRHWFRAKFHNRYRLFFRFSSESGIIIYAWIHDENSLRKSGSRTDPYAMFRAMLESGDPPASSAELLRGSKGVDSI